MKSLVRTLAWVLGIVGIGAIVLIAMRPQPVLVDTVSAEQGKLLVTIDEDGLTRIKDRYVVSTPLAGRLERVKLEVGDYVAADTTVIATMQATDPSLLDPRAVAQAQARVKAAERRLEAARAEMTKAKSSEEYAHSELVRTQDLEAQNAVSASELESKEMEYRVRSEEARAAGFGVGIAEYELELERAALMLTAPASEVKSPGDKGMELSIKAPINGRVLRVYRESAAVLTAGASIIEIGDPLDLEVVTDVLSVDAVRVTLGDPVLLENWGGDRPLQGEVRVVEPSGFTKLSALGVEEQRVNVIIDILDPPQQRETLGDGFRVDSRIIVLEQPDVLKLPTSSLFRVQSAWQVFLVRDGVARQVEVEIGENNGIEAEVLSGVRQGETVIVHPSDAVADGVAVQQRGR